jgi:16S rRNA (guanine527-N7)-methyltransferase
MPNASAGASPPPLPAELIPDFERFRAALGAPAAALFDPSAEAALLAYGRLLHEKSSGLALIAKGDRSEVFTRHILDSLNLISLFRGAPVSALDVGSGGGLPGIPLAIAWPETRVVLLESRERKAGFLESAVRTLGLKNARVVCARLEEYGDTWREEPVASVFVRALGDLDRVLGEAARASLPGARWVYFLGSRSPDEALPPGSVHAGVVSEGAFGGRLLTGGFPAIPS